MRYFLGVDTGATKSHALLANERGTVVGFTEDGPGNWEAIGEDGMRRMLRDIVEQTLRMAGVTRAQVAGAGFGLAGYDWPEDRPIHEKIIASLALGGPAIIGNDTLIGLVAGATEGWGVVVSAGTSNNAFGRDRQGNPGRMGGMGRVLGEFGGAYEVVEKALQAIGRAWSLRGRQTALTAVFTQAVGAEDAFDMFAGLARGRYAITPGLAPLVVQTAESGDPVASAIMQWAGEELGSLAVGIIRQLKLQDEAFEVVLSGSFFKSGPLLVAPMRQTVHAEAPLARLVRLNAPPVAGGVLLGMEAAGMDTAVIRPKLLQSAQNLKQFSDLHQAG
jgi:N-acetylglucosamine kinase-like BadF-type ATPase